MRYMTLVLAGTLGEECSIPVEGLPGSDRQKLLSYNTINGIEVETGRRTTINLTENAKLAFGYYLDQRAVRCEDGEILSFLVDDVKPPVDKGDPTIEAIAFLKERTFPTLKVQMSELSKRLPKSAFGHRYELAGTLIKGAKKGGLIRVSVSNAMFLLPKPTSAKIIATGFLAIKAETSKVAPAFLKGEPLAIKKCVPLTNGTFFSGGSVAALPFQTSAEVVAPGKEAGRAEALFGLTASSITLRFLNSAFKGLDAVISFKDPAAALPKQGDTIGLDLMRKLNSNEIYVSAVRYPLAGLTRG